MPSLALASVLVCAAFVMAAVSIAGATPRRVIGYVLSLSVGAIAPALAPREALLGRTVLAFAALGLSLRAMDLVRRSNSLSVFRRLAHVTSLVDSDRLVRAAPRVDLGALGRLVGFAPLAIVGGITVYALRGAQGPWVFWARMAAVLAMVYGSVELLFAMVRMAYAALGFAIPVMHRDPILSRSLREFWSERWNLIVHQSLLRHCFLPLARRGHGRWGMALAFVVSAALHVYLLAFMAGLRGGLLAGLFFLVQGALVLVERALGVARRPVLLGRAWTSITLLGTSPLFFQGLPGVLGW